MNGGRRAAALVLAAVMILSLAGCSASGAERLYALPQMADEYVQLEDLIAHRISEGSEYAAPLGGINRQSVQMHDLDGDGEAEAIAFLADSAHTPTVCVYRRHNAGDYYLDVIISGEGSAVSSVEYADLTGDGAEEVVIAWQISGDIRLLSAYSLAKEEPTALLSADCTGFYVCDLDGDGVRELLVLRTGEGGADRLARYAFSADGQNTVSEAPLSAAAEDVLRMKNGYLDGGVPALFIDSRRGDSQAVTDVFASQSGSLVNLTAKNSRDNSTHPDTVFAEDIDGDRITEVPEASDDSLSWFALDAAGNKTLIATTYHNCDDGWYLVLTDMFPPDGLNTERSSTAPGESAVTFSARADAEDPVALVTIYTLTGENRMDRASDAHRFTLAQNETTVYAAELAEGSPLTRQKIEESFNLIYPEWQM